jgi:hypothetical protein
MVRARLYLALSLIIVLHLLGNLYWISRNVVLVGRDAAGHLERTVETADALRSVSLPAFFKALTVSDYRPPLLYLLTVPFYRLFGTNLDSAQYTNVALLAALLLLTFVLGRRVTTANQALFAVLLTGLLPMTWAMTRLFYIENLLTTLLLINLLALLNSKGFTQRRWSLVWGLSLGLTLLTKWTAPIYILLPTLYTLWPEPAGRTWTFVKRKQATPGELRIAKADTRNSQLATRNSPWPLDWHRLLYATGGALLWAILWYWPNQALIGKFPLGMWTAVGWFVVAALTLYAVSLRSTVRNNLFSALLLAVTLASLWYFPRIDFLNHLSDVAFGTDRGTQESFSLLRLSNYTRYFGFWLTHHMGPLATLLILPPALWGWYRKMKPLPNPPQPLQGKFGEGADMGYKKNDAFTQPLPLPQAGGGWEGVSSGSPQFLLWLMILSTWLILTFIAQANPRNLNPLLPVIAILLADSLRGYGRRVAWGLGVLWVGVLMLQWSIYTFDGLAWLQQRAPVLWVQGDYLAWPAHGSSDPGYWIQPDVLATIGNPQGEAASLGMLIDSWEIHRGSLRYLIAANHLNIELNALTEDDSRGWSDLLANQWVLLKTGDNSTVKAPGQQMLARIHNGDPLFNLLYREAKRYSLPSGETAILYRRAEGPARPYEFPVVLIETAKIAETINHDWSPGATLYFGNADTATWVGIHDLKADRLVMPQRAGESAQTLLAATHGTILAVTRYDTAEVQNWLFANSYPAFEFGDGEFKLTVVGRPTQPLQPLPVRAAWPEVQITALRGLPELSPGAVLPLEVQMAGPADGSRKLSLRLLDAGGQVLAQQDKSVEPQFRLGLLVPPQAQPGTATLAAIVYDANTLATTRDTQGNELAPITPIILSASATK